MTVSAEYAQSHLDELLAATAAGETVEITRRDGFAATLTPFHKPMVEDQEFIDDRSGLFGAMKGDLWRAEDWDAPETNAEIASHFNESELFPPAS